MALGHKLGAVAVSGERSLKTLVENRRAFTLENLDNPTQCIALALDQNKIQVDDLSEKACMSRASFYRAFEREFQHQPARFYIKGKNQKSKKSAVCHAGKRHGYMLSARLFRPQLFRPAIPEIRRNIAQ